MCVAEDLKVATWRYAYQFLSFPINYRLFISIIFSFSWNWYSNGSTANGKENSLSFVQAWGSWNHFSISAKCNLSLKMRAYCIHFATITKKSTLDIFLTNLLFWPFFSSKKSLFLDLNCLHFYRLLLKLFPHWDNTVWKSKAFLLLTERHTEN